ncbi:MAG: cytochrome C, partial [Gammaproteobacteria bacterium]|nr:cytochrome C [Gammaproteobacteria bacterium]
APYWRVAYQGGSDPYYFSVGAFGLSAKLQPDPTVPATDRFTDVAFDATFQYVNEGRSALTVNAAVIHESASLGASFAAGATGSDSNHLTSSHLDATYTWQQTWSVGAGVFDVSGGSDSTLYAPDPVDGSLAGSPDTQGYIVQLEWIPLGKSTSWARPWVNVRLGLQYTGYTKFNGSGSNYDGFGRAASDNNSLFLFYWMAF